MPQMNLLTGQEETEKVYSSQSHWSKLVRTRDGYKCANAEKYPDRDHKLFKLNVHHINPKKDGGKNLMSNGITYCRACHAAEHPEYQQKFIGDFTFRKMLYELKDVVRVVFGKPRELQYYKLLEFLTGAIQFRPLQKQIIKTIVEERKHVFAVLPTGTGKSLLYQLPGLMKEGEKTLVLSPLKALQVNQVQSLLKHWVPATYINSSLSKSEILERIAAIISGDIPFAFIHPKQLLNYSKENHKTSVKTHNQLAQIPFDSVVVDEAHVVERYGISFVKEYYQLKLIKELYPQAQMTLLTATASKATRQLIIKNLGLPSNLVEEFVSGFYRPEITLEVYETNLLESNRSDIPKDSHESTDHLQTLLRLLRQRNHSGKTLIFATTTDRVDTLHLLLNHEGFVVNKYHSKMSENEKELSYRQFISNGAERVDMMVATSAFGMGIDIPNIRQVIHDSVAFSLTDYYQQIGRAARDGRPAVAQLLYDSRNPFGMFDYINGQTLEAESDPICHEMLRAQFETERLALQGYVRSDDRWKYLLDYFGEKKSESIFIWKNFVYLMILIICIFLILGFNFI